jgi:hypothetical protein
MLSSPASLSVIECLHDPLRIPVLDRTFCVAQVAGMVDAQFDRVGDANL